MGVMLFRGSQLKSPGFSPPAASPPVGFPGVSGMVNCWFGVRPVAGKSLAEKSWKRASMFLTAVLCACLCWVWGLFTLVEEAGLASKEFIPDRLLPGAVRLPPLLLPLLALSEDDVVEFGVGRSDDGAASGERAGSTLLPSFPKLRSMADPKDVELPVRIRSRYDIELSAGHRPLKLLKFGMLVCVVVRLGSISMTSFPLDGLSSGNITRTHEV